MPIKKNSTIKWDPTIIKLIETKMTNTNPKITNSNIKVSKTHKNKINTTKKRRSPEEFQKYLREMLNQDGPTIKYQNPDSWYLH